ncbi:MAG: GNAT family N-acetyltransferase [Nevskia sp.]
MLRIVEITDGRGRFTAPEWLPRAEAVHRQLRPQLMADYAGEIARVAEGGARLVLAVEAEAVLGLAVWRVLEKTFTRREFYVDDLVTDAARRSAGVGHALLAWCEATARTLGCTQLALDSGTQRQLAHKFYFREGLPITSFHFTKPL